MKDLLEKAAAEIRMLRRENEILAAKVEVMDLFACTLHTRPAGTSRGMSEDIAWALDKAAAETERPSPADVTGILVCDGPLSHQPI